MKNYMVTVVSTWRNLAKDPIDDMASVNLLQFGPCSKDEGDALADRINAWIRGGEGHGVAEAFRVLGLDQRSGDVFASCNEIPSTGIAELLKKFFPETTV